MKNKYQSWLDWVLGRWKCPKCKIMWYSSMVLYDCGLNKIENLKTIERRLECLNCDFIKVIE